MSWIKMVWIFSVAFILSSTTALALNISFFEEFPSEETLEKLEFFDFPTRIYLGAHNLSEFYVWQKNIEAQTNGTVQVVYWPILAEEEGYWVSPWSKPKALEQTFNELLLRGEKKPLTVMLDLEFPKKKRQINTRWGSQEENLQTIINFLQEAPQQNISVITVEKSYFPDWFLRALGLSYPTKTFGNQRIKLYYTSFQRELLPNSIVDFFYRKKTEKAAKEGYGLAIGLLAPGIYGNEPTYALATLGKELQIAQEAGVKEVIIFRLAGVTEEIPAILQRFISNISQTAETAALSGRKE